ncbi:KICSTOR complex protein kaptin-like [Centruroides sculpturatus]|uniref:KICSTOR complex protein kaptin-like n=1 Tax=Centruroides sculpturatus TaxID=218467 RepID=UPI000C6D31AE|nr:KICSTOR complex protein kaptin-like [Centruroides sculpturatus]
MNEFHFSGLTSQSNIYGLTTLTTSDGLSKVLIASRKRKVYCIEYTKNEVSTIPSTTEVQFTYIPGGAEIISIDAFNKSTENHDFLVGITFVKLGEQFDSSAPVSTFFNIYSEWQPVTECNLDNIAQGCFSLTLNFIPYHLTHVKVITENNEEIVWLLSGGDCKVHVYKEDKSHQCFCEEPPNLFPEFDNLSGIVQWMDQLKKTK